MYVLWICVYMNNSEIQDMIYAVPLLPLTLRFVLTVAPLNNTHASLTKQIAAIKVQLIQIH